MPFTTKNPLTNFNRQNAALVEEAAAASGAMRNQAADLAQAVSVFKLNAFDALSLMTESVATRQRVTASLL